MGIAEQVGKRVNYGKSQSAVFRDCSLENGLVERQRANCIGGSQLRAIPIAPRYRIIVTHLWTFPGFQGNRLLNQHKITG
jgi:hypothetical protein